MLLAASNVTKDEAGAEGAAPRRVVVLTPASEIDSGAIVS
jgi:hypothetical protein